jgi:L-amino acid N-acyltransferase YncA
MTTQHLYKLVVYPKDVPLRDGARVTIKPMTAEDASALLQLFLRIPPDERYYLKEDVTSPDVIWRWVKELDYGRALPLLTWVGNRIVADGSLHRPRSQARRHVGEIRIVVDPEYRSLGLGTFLMHELAVLARQNGLERLLFQAVAGKEEAAIGAARAMGFVEAGRLSHHAKDNSGDLRDIVLLEMPLEKLSGAAYY